MKTIVGLYDDWSTARQVVEELARAGFDRNDINLIANDANQEFAHSLGTTDGNGTAAAEGAAAGALAGGALGGIGGLLLGLGALAIPGVGPVIAAGPIAAGLTGAAVGAATGGIIGALANWGIPEEEAGYYAEGIRRGGTLVGVRADEGQVDRALEIMNRFSPVDIQRRSSEWRTSGWTGFDPDAEEYTFTSDMYSANDGQNRQTGRGWAEVERDQSDMGMTGTGVAGSTLGSTTTDRDFAGKGMARMDTKSEGMSTMDVDHVEGEKAIPIVEEELRVGKREVERGTVRVHSYVEETPVHENVSLREERVTVERRPVDRAVDPSTIDAFQERTIEMSETAEEVVAEKTARVVEEVVVGKEVDTRTKRVEDTIRRTKVEIDDSTGGQTTDWSNYNTGWRTHYNQYYGTTGRNYDYYQPGYRYGYDLANNARYSGRDWNTIEADARRDWEATGQGAWEDFKDAIRHGWNEVKQAVS